MAVMLRTKTDAQRFRAGDLLVEVFHEDVVVPAGVHFREADLLLPRAHRVDVHEFYVARAVAALDDPGERVRLRFAEGGAECTVDSVNKGD